MDKFNKEIEKIIFEDKDVMDLRFKINDIQRKNSFERKANQRRIIQYSSIAAIGILLITASIIFTNINKEIISKDYLRENYPEADFIRGELIQMDKELQSALVLYKNKNYDAAIIRLESYIKKKPENIAAIHYLAACNLESENYDKAILYFKKVVEHADNVYIDQAEWLLALTYIRINKPGKAKIWLNDIINKKYIYADKAKSLLKKIE